MSSGTLDQAQSLSTGEEPAEAQAGPTTRPKHIYTKPSFKLGAC